MLPLQFCYRALIYHLFTYKCKNTYEKYYMWIEGIDFDIDLADAEQIFLLTRVRA